MPNRPSNTTGKQPKDRRRPPVGRRFTKNNPETGERDERINRKGRPRTSDALKEMILDIFEREGQNATTGEKVTILEHMLTKMAVDGTPPDRSELLNRGFGKVPDAIVFSLDDVRKIIDYLPDDMLDRLAKGDALGDVLVAWITTLGDGQTGPDIKRT